MFSFFRRKSIQPIEPGPLLGKLRQVVTGPNKEAEELKKEKLIDDFLIYLGEINRENIDSKEPVAEFESIFNDEALFERAFEKVSTEEKKLILEMTLLYEDGFSDFIASRLEKENPDYKLALEVVINIPQPDLEYYIRKLSIYGPDIKRLAEALLMRPDRDTVIDIAERAVFNPEKLPELDENDNYIDAMRLSRMLLGNHYREPQDLYLYIIEKLAPDYDLDKLEEFYKIAIEDGNKGNRTRLKKTLIAKYERESVRELFLNIIGDNDLKYGRFIHLRKQALWHLVDLLKKDIRADLLKMIKEQDATIGIEAIKALCDKAINGTEGQKRLIKTILDDIKKEGSSGTLNILAMAKEPYKTDYEYLSSNAEILGRMYGSKNPFVENYLDIIEILLKEIRNISRILSNTKDTGFKYTNDFNVNLSPVQSLIRNIGLERLALYATQSVAAPEQQILKKNAQALLGMADDRELKHFLSRESEGAYRLKKAIGFD